MRGLRYVQIWIHLISKRPGRSYSSGKTAFNVMATPLVSVLTTAYNCEKYIAEAIESVLASSFKDFELIIERLDFFYMKFII